MEYYVKKLTRKTRRVVERAYVKVHFREIDYFTVWVTAIQAYLKNNVPKATIIYGTRWNMLDMADIRPLHPDLKGSKLSHALGMALKEVLFETEGWSDIRITSTAIYFN